MKIFFVLAFLPVIFSCKPNSPNTQKGDTTYRSVANKVDIKRDKPNALPVDQYQEKVDNDLNDWFFSVKLFETENRFTYRISLQYEEVSGKDEITFPNLGGNPQPQLRKGQGKYECIIGFLDKEGNFRQYKKVHVANGNLKITTLKSYVTTIK